MSERSCPAHSLRRLDMNTKPRIAEPKSQAAAGSGTGVADCCTAACTATERAFASLTSAPAAPESGRSGLPGLWSDTSLMRQTGVGRKASA